MCRFVEIRRAFHLPRKNPVIYRHFDSIIQLDEIFEKYECDLDDLLNVYKIFNDKLEKISRDDLHRCDQIVKGMALDKECALYYDKSRKLLSIEDFEASIKKHSEIDDQFMFKLPKDILAIKSLKIYKKKLS